MSSSRDLTPLVLIVLLMIVGRVCYAEPTATWLKWNEEYAVEVGRLEVVSMNEVKKIKNHRMRDQLTRFGLKASYEKLLLGFKQMIVPDELEASHLKRMEGVRLNILAVEASGDSNFKLSGNLIIRSAMAHKESLIELRRLAKKHHASRVDFSMLDSEIRAIDKEMGW